MAGVKLHVPLALKNRQTDVVCGASDVIADIRGFARVVGPNSSDLIEFIRIL
jgi:hypothetical protein